jgi:hypothetical protein
MLISKVELSMMSPGLSQILLLLFFIFPSLPNGHEVDPLAFVFGWSNFLVGISPFYQTLHFSRSNNHIKGTSPALDCLIFVVTLFVDFGQFCCYKYSYED